MNRIAVLTVGITHSGKSSFARSLRDALPRSVIIDQDNHARFVNTHYRALIPQQGPNTIKYAISRVVLDQAIETTDQHLILCNSNRYREPRLALLSRFRERGFLRVLVYFDVPDVVLEARVAHSTRRTDIFRRASSFAEVLQRQRAGVGRPELAPPRSDEAEHFFLVDGSDKTCGPVISEIVQIAAGLSRKAS